MAIPKIPQSVEKDLRPSADQQRTSGRNQYLSVLVGQGPGSGGSSFDDVELGRIVQ